MSDESPTTPFLRAISDRLSHPVCGIFSLAFIACNWKPIFFLVASDNAAGPRIAEAVAYTDYTTLLSWPILATVSYAFAAPVLKKMAVIWDLKIDRSTDKLVTDYDIEKRIQTVARLQEQAKNLKVKLSELQGQIETERGQQALLSEKIKNLEEHHRFLSTFETVVKDVQRDEESPFGSSPAEISQRLRSMFARLDLMKQMLVDQGVIQPAPIAPAKR